MSLQTYLQHARLVNEGVIVCVCVSINMSVCVNVCAKDVCVTTRVCVCVCAFVCVSAHTCVCSCVCERALTHYVCPMRERDAPPPPLSHTHIQKGTHAR